MRGCLWAAGIPDECARSGDVCAPASGLYGEAQILGRLGIVMLLVGASKEKPYRGACRRPHTDFE